jgi:hypothetical protein
LKTDESLKDVQLERRQKVIFVDDDASDGQVVERPIPQCFNLHRFDKEFWTCNMKPTHRCVTFYFHLDIQKNIQQDICKTFHYMRSHIGGAHGRKSRRG